MIFKEIEKHIETEAAMIKNSLELMEKMERGIAKFLLGTVVEDEKFHHKLLTEVRDIILRRKTLVDSERWEKIRRKSLYRE